MNTVHEPEVRAAIIKDLDAMGFQVGEEAKGNGALVDWKILGPIPWMMEDPYADEKALGAPHLQPDQAYSYKGQRYSWIPYRTHLAHGEVDLDGMFGDDPNVAIYAYGEFPCDRAQEVQLMIGSNDGFRCWLNGVEAGAFEGGRQYQPDQDVLKVRTRKGINTVLIKVTQQGNEWGFGVRVTDTDNRPLDLNRK